MNIKTIVFGALGCSALVYSFSLPFVAPHLITDIAPWGIDFQVAGWSVLLSVGALMLVAGIVGFISSVESDKPMRSALSVVNCVAGQLLMLGGLGIIPIFAKEGLLIKWTIAFMLLLIWSGTTLLKYAWSTRTSA